MSDNNTTKEGNNDSEKKVEKTTKESKATNLSKPVKKEVAEKTENDKRVVADVDKAPVKKKRKKIRRQVRRGRAYIKSSYNNTLVLFTDMHGNSLAWSSAGLLGFKGAKKATTYAANQVALDADEKVQKYGLKDIEVFVRGVGSGRDAALRALVQKGYNLLSIKDITPVPHNGCRPKKPRRV